MTLLDRLATWLLNHLAWPASLRRSMRELLRGLTILVVVSSSALAEKTPEHRPVSFVDPMEAAWGESVTVTYRPESPGAALRGDDPILVSMTVYRPDRIDSECELMTREGASWIHAMEVPSGVSAVEYTFYTLDEWDSDHRAIVFARDGEGNPARGANVVRMYRPIIGPWYTERFADEIRLYPDNTAAYARKWKIDRLYESSYAGIIREELEIIRDRIPDRSLQRLEIELEAARLLEETERAIEIEDRLVEGHPTSDAASRILERRSFGLPETSRSQTAAVHFLLQSLRFARDYPDTRFARLAATVTENLQETVVTVPSVVALDDEARALLDQAESILDNVLLRWQAREPDDPSPYLGLANLYKQRDDRLQLALDLATTAVELTLRGERRCRGDFRPLGESLAEIYELQAELSASLNRHATAIAFSRAAASFRSDAGGESAFSDQPFLLEAASWEDVQAPSRSEIAYLQAAQRGSPPAEQALRSLHVSRAGTEDGFVEYLEAAKSKRQNGAPGTVPDLEVQPLDAEPLSLSSLTGRVLVINFWFTGCKPCRREIPVLNQLVEEFAERDVVFLAPALDREGALRRFLQQVPFRYQVVPQAANFAEAFAVVAYPTHLVLDRCGKIVLWTSGGGTGIKERLRHAIEGALGNPG